MNNIYSALMPHISNSVERNTASKQPNSGANSGSGFDALLTSITTTTTTTVKTQSVSKAALGGGELTKFIQQIMASMDDSLSNILSPSDEYDKKTKGSSSLNQASTIFDTDVMGDASDIYGIGSASASGGIFDFDYESFVNGGGPLPAYLKMLDKSLNLSAEKSQKLRDIAWDNRNIVKSPESVKALGDQLREAGIG